MSVATWRSPPRSSAAARGAMFGSIAAWLCREVASAPSVTARADVARLMVARMNIQDANLARVTPVFAAAGLQRDVAVLAGRVPVPLPREGPERDDQARPAFPRVDHVVHVAACRGCVRVVDLCGVLVAQSGGLRGGIGR